MKQPESYIQEGKKNKMSFKEVPLWTYSPRQWYKWFDSFMIKTKYNRCEYDSCVYFKQSDDLTYCCYM